MNINEIRYSELKEVLAYLETENVLSWADIISALINAIEEIEQLKKIISVRQA